MKRIFSVLLALCFVASCGESNTSSTETSSQDYAEVFVKPQEYASVLLVTINPQFKLYLDENGKVLAMEAVNEDAKSLKNSISFENESFETVIEAIVTEANKNGFVKADATINVEIVESKEENKAQSDILSNVEKTVANIAEALKIEIKVNIGEIKTDNDTNSSNTESSNHQSSSKTTVTQSSSVAKPGNTQSSSKPAHTHSYSAATCTQPKKCSCGAVEGNALGHNYKDGVCTRCKAKDSNYKPLTSVLQKQGKWKFQYLKGTNLYSVNLIICTSEENFVNVPIGDLLTTLPEDMQNHPDTKKYCEVFNGKYYYVGKGDGDKIKSVKEENGTVTVTDSSENNLVLTRTDENTLKCTSAPKTFACGLEIPVGSEFILLQSNIGTNLHLKNEITVLYLINSV